MRGKFFLDSAELLRMREQRGKAIARSSVQVPASTTHEMRNSGITVVTRDIIDGEHAEWALRESEEKYRALVENSPNIMTIIQEGSLKYVNNAAYKRTGWTSEELTSPSFNFVEKVVSKKFRDTAKANIAKRLRGEIIPPYEINLLARDGSEIPVIVHAQKTFFQGKPADEVILIDITERKRMEEDIQHRLEFEKAVSKISTCLVGVSDIDSAINVSLASIGRLSGASRAYVFLFRENGTLMDNTHEWCAEGVSRQISNLRNLSTDKFPWWMTSLRKGEVVQIDDASKMPLEARVEQEILLEDQDIKSLLVVPFNIRGELAGFIGFDNVVGTRPWSDSDLALLKVSSKIIGDAIEHKQMEDSLRRHSEHLEKLVEERTGELRENERLIRLLTDALPVLVSYVDSEQRYRFNNKTYEDWFQQPRTEVTGKHVKSVLGEQAYLDIQRYVEEALSGKKVTYESTVHYRNGGPRYVLANYIPHLDNQGKVKGFYALVSDITYRRQMEKTLQESEARYRAVVDTQTEHIIRSLPDWTITFANDAYCRFHGMKREELIGKNYASFMLDEERDKVRTMQSMLRPENPLVTYEERGRASNGEIRLVEWIDHGIFDAKGHLAEIESAGHDITERNKLEEELKTLNASIVERLTQKISQIDDVSRLREKVRKSPDVSAALDLVLDSVLNTFDADVGAIYVIDSKRNLAELRSFKSKIEGFQVRQNCHLDGEFVELQAAKEAHAISKVAERDQESLMKMAGIHCAPILFREEVYGFLALGSQITKTQDQNDLAVLSLYSDLAATIFEKEQLTITPVKETHDGTKRRFKLEFGNAYFIRDDVEKAFEVFVDNVLSGVDGLCITRVFPPKVRERYGLEKTPIVWLTEEKAEGQMTVHTLQDLSILIANFLERTQRGVVLIDGFEYLMMNHGFEPFLRFLQLNRSRFELNDSILISPITEQALDTREAKLVEREMKTLVTEKEENSI